MTKSDLTKTEQEYLQILIDGVRLSDIEMEATFGDELQSLRSNLVIRKLSADEKIKQKRRKNLVSDFKLEETIRIIPLALKTIVQIMQNGEESNRLRAAQTIVRPTLSYLEKHGQYVASVEIADDISDGAIKLMYNLETMVKSEK